jgi:hypothetical protein
MLGSHDTTLADCYGQISAGDSRSAFEGPKHEDFMLSLGSSWALDQCDNLYDLLDGEYFYLHDTSHLAGPYQVQGTTAHPPGHIQSFPDFHIQSPSGDMFEETTGFLSAPVDDPSVWAVEIPKFM